jgi:hypothetical protein
MKCFVVIWMLLGAGMGVAGGQRPAPGSRHTSAINLLERGSGPSASITFLTAANGAPVQGLGTDEGMVNLGSVSNCSRPDEHGAQILPQKDSFVVSTRVGLRLDLSNATGAGTATVSAYLLRGDPLRTVWVDGVRLSTMPGIIARQVSYGAVTEHVLKIEVPRSMPAGQLMDLIGVIVTPN